MWPRSRANECPLRPRQDEGWDLIIQSRLGLWKSSNPNAWLRQRISSSAYPRREPPGSASSVGVGSVDPGALYLMSPRHPFQIYQRAGRVLVYVHMQGQILGILFISIPEFGPSPGTTLLCFRDIGRDPRSIKISKTWPLLNIWHPSLGRGGECRPHALRSSGKNSPASVTIDIHTVLGAPLGTAPSRPSLFPSRLVVLGGTRIRAVNPRSLSTLFAFVMESSHTRVGWLDGRPHHVHVW